MGEHDSRQRSGARPNVDLQEQIVEAIQAGLARYQDKRNAVDINMLERLRADMNEGFRKVDNNFGMVNGRLDTMDSRLGQGTSRFAVQETKMSRVEKDIEELRRTATTERLLTSQSPEAETDEREVVSNKFKNAIWLGIAGSIGAGIVFLAGAAFKPVDPPAKADPPAVTSPPVTPASPRASIPSPQHETATP